MTPLQHDQIIADHKKDKDLSIKFKERRFEQWNQNYSLFRDKVSTNRLTQRQPINVPIIRETIASWISKIDEPPKIKYETKDRTNKDKTGELLFNDIYKYYYDKLKLDILDNVEKKIVGLTGRGFKKIGMSGGEIFIDIIDPYDIEVDPRVNPLDLESADFIIHTHIFRSLKQVLANKKYDTEAKKILTQFVDSKSGLLESATNDESAQLRKQRLENLGVSNFEEFGATDTLIEINESYKNVWDEKEQRFVRHLRVIAMDSVCLYDEKLKDAIGIDCVPIVTWASDPDAVDFWSDGIADNVRTYNKITNMYMSQDLENRTYANFKMYFFNTMNGTFQPRAFDPKPFGMYGVPGNPAELVQQIDIKPLPDISNQITWLKNMIQSSVAQTPTERGVKEAGEQTLGQVQIQLAGSRGMNQVVSKNYRAAWKEIGRLFYELMKENSSGTMKLSKKGSDGNYYSRDVSPTDWKSPNGYEVIVENEADRSIADDFDLKKLQYVKNSFMNNATAINIAKKKELEILDFTGDEIEAIMSAENQAQPLNVPQEAPSKVNNPQDSVASGNQNMLNAK